MTAYWAHWWWMLFLTYLFGFQHFTFLLFQTGDKDKSIFTLEKLTTFLKFYLFIFKLQNDRAKHRTSQSS